MMGSIWDDFKYNITKGTRLNQVILINVTVFILILFVRIILNITEGGANTAFNTVTTWLSLNTDLSYLITHPWILVTHMFTHIGAWHLIWNMLMLYWMGNIVGDLIGDKYIWRVYLFSGLFAAVLMLLFSKLFHYPADIYMAHGASAAVMGFVLAATVIAPDYILHLMLIGPVKLKYVALVIVLLDLVGIAEQTNTGGHLGHIGGAIGGVVFIWALRKGWFDYDYFSSSHKKEKGKIIPLHKTIKPVVDKSITSKTISKEIPNTTHRKQEEIDRILDKISSKGIHSLSKDEKELLDSLSK